MKELQITTALFDLDGVVFDTESQYTKFWGSQCRLYHPDNLGLEYKIKGQTLVQIFDKYFSTPELVKEQNNIIKRLNDFESHMQFEYVDGFVDFIGDLRKKNIHTAVVTSSNKAKMSAVYTYHPEFCSMFDAILTSEDFDKSKPDPDCYFKAANRFNAEPKECVVFEDSFNGLKAGKAAGMWVIGLSTTNSANLIAPYCNYVITNYEGVNYQKMKEMLEI